ncbi:glucuronoyl esterase [Irpex rosettiformis]|uniref:Glucuronoyl esterase n=1 Tax=Irpex rosettiformis TaxID=378272 RepID=A0ACB8U9G2_9APHY|nr:glucuronoyl esterase [Irpex rosettiformis]
MIPLFILSLLTFVLAAATIPSSQLEALPDIPLSCSTPATIPGFNRTSLPNPFVFNDGRPVRTVEDWACRRAQISALVQGYEAGFLPPKPSIVQANFTQNGTSATLGVTAGFSNTTISFSSRITFPTTNAPAGGFPLLIAYDGLSIPVPDGVATLIFINDALGQQNSLSSRGKGLFFDLYGANASASSMTAWVWGVSRIIDALELSPHTNINLKKLAVTGCSRDGKGALMAGAFETRIALTIPQESGSGGDTCWRLSKFEQDSGDVVQQATEIVQENVWFSPTFDQYVNEISVLPYDHHMLAAMVAPRALISFENTDFEWLSPLSGFGCMTAAHTVFQALGIPDNHGFVQAGNHSHCLFPESQNDQLFAFFDKFLLNQNANTSVFTTNGLFNGTVFDVSQWIDWTTPRLRRS